MEPGILKTDFAGRSLDFINDESLVEHRELVGKLFKAMKSLAANASETRVVADVI